MQDSGSEDDGARGRAASQFGGGLLANSGPSVWTAWAMTAYPSYTETSTRFTEWPSSPTRWTGSSAEGRSALQRRDTFVPWCV